MNKYHEYKERLKNYTNDISKIEVLSDEEERYYFSLLETSINIELIDDVEDILIRSYLKYIIKIVLDYSHQDYEYFDDFMIAGINGCLKAINNYDYKLNNKFLSYATIWIEGEIIKEIKKDHDYMIDYNSDEEYLDYVSVKYERLGDYKDIDFDKLIEFQLNNKEKYVIKSLYGYKSKKLTLEEIGIEYNVSKQAIYKVKKRALNKLKESLK